MSAIGAGFTMDRVRVAFDQKVALAGISASITPGEQVAFVGPSGAGKTSALRLLNASLRPTEGTVTVDDLAMNELSAKALMALRTEIGFVHQDLNLVPNLRVVQNVLAGRLGRMGFFRSARAMLWPSKSTLHHVHELLDRVGISDKMFERTDRLSGGQRQRVAIARALYQDARALLVDEPVSSLDPARSRDTISLLTSVAKERGMTLVASMHDLELAREYFGRLIGLRDGNIVFDRPPAEVPQSAITDLFRIETDEMLADGC